MTEKTGPEHPKKKPRYLSGDEIAGMFGNLSVLEEKNITLKKGEEKKT